jgi:hypothetical protein
MARLADLQKLIDEATEEVRHLTQDEQNRRPQHRELHQEGFFNEDDWYEDFHHGNLLLMMLLLCQQNCRLHLGLTMGYNFCTIRFKDRSGLGSGFICSHF